MTLSGGSVGVTLAVSVAVGVSVAVRVGVEVAVALGIGITTGVRVALGSETGVKVAVSGVSVGARVAVALAVGVAVPVTVAPGVGLSISVGVALAASSDTLGGAGVGVVMMTPAAIAFGIRAGVGGSVAPGTVWITVDTGLEGGIGAEMDVRPAGAATVGPGAASEACVSSSLIARATGSRELGGAVTADGRMRCEADRVLRVGVDIGSRDITCTRSVPPQPTSSKPASNMSKIQRALRFITTSSDTLGQHFFVMSTPVLSAAAS